MLGLKKIWGTRRLLGKNSNKVVSTTPELSEQALEVCSGKSANLDLRRSVLDWRDRHVEKTELQLHRELSKFFDSLEKQLEKMSVSDIFFHEKAFGRENIEPLYLAWVEQEASTIIEDAQQDLRGIFSHALYFEHSKTNLEQNEANEHYTDAAIAAAATGAGLAAIPVFAGASVVSAGGILGFIGLTVISWPIAALGFAAVGGLLAVGGYKSAELKSSAVSRYRSRVKKLIIDQVLGSKSSSNSVSQNIQSHISRAAKTILAEIDA